MAKRSLAELADQIVEDVLEGSVSIESGIEELNKRLEVYDYVKLQRDKLMAARRALLGVGNRQTANAGTKITSDEVAKTIGSMRPGEDPGMTVAELVAKVPGSNDGQIRGHLNRGAGERFLKRPSDNRWFLRDPEAGINTVEDLPDEDE